MFFLFCFCFSNKRYIALKTKVYMKILQNGWRKSGTQFLKSETEYPKGEAQF